MVSRGGHRCLSYTQVGIVGLHLAKRQSIMLSSKGNFRWTVWEKKLVSTKTLYGGTRALLYVWNICEGICSIFRTTSPLAVFFSFSFALSCSFALFSFNRASRLPMTRFTCPNFLVFFATPIATVRFVCGLEFGYKGIA